MPLASSCDVTGMSLVFFGDSDSDESNVPGMFTRHAVAKCQ